MNLNDPVADFARRGIRLIPDGEGLIVKPASRLTNEDRQPSASTRPNCCACSPILTIAPRR